MQNFKIFLVTFLSSLCIVFAGFGALYWLSAPSPQTAGTNQNNIPITKATISDSKTILVYLHSQTDGAFLLIKLNAVNNSASVTAIPADYYISHRSRTLAQSFEYAGIMQCVQDLSEHLDTDINYHLDLDCEKLPQFDLSFISAGTASDIPFTDLLSLASLTAQAIKNNISEIQSLFLPIIPANFSYLYTNMGKTEIAHISRILTLLVQNNADFDCTVLTNN